MLFGSTMGKCVLLCMLKIMLLCYDGIVRVESMQHVHVYWLLHIHNHIHKSW